MENMEGLKRAVDRSFWSGKKVFLTGHTGFKGSWLSLWLLSMGAEVKGYALEPITTPSLFELADLKSQMLSEIGDIRDYKTIESSISQFQPDILIHMAAQPLVRRSYQDPLETYSTNVMGTVNVLEAAKQARHLKAVVSVTSDKCYENKEWYWGYRENEPLGGHDPYSNSKACAELVTSAYRDSFYYSDDSAFIASARAGNVIGGGDWAEDRLIPDILKAFEKKTPVIIRNPMARRPWQHVLEPLSGYLILAESLYNHGTEFAEAWNFGPKDEDCKPVGWILEKMQKQWGKGASWELDKANNPHEAAFLKLDWSKAESRLNWQPKWRLEKALELTINWHKHWASGTKMSNICLEEIEQYQK